MSTSMFSFGYGNNDGGDSDEFMDPMNRHRDANLLSAGSDSIGEDLVMNDLAADILPFDLDLNALPDSSPQHAPSAHVLEPTDTAQAADGGQLDEKKSGEVVIGAGPLPTGFGVALGPGQGSTLTEFTKRRNWSQRIIEELKDFLHVLTAEGLVIYVSPSAKGITGYEGSALVGKLIFDFIHQDDHHVFMREFNESIASGNPMRFFYRFRKADDSYVILECHGHPHFDNDAPQNADGSASACRGFFMMSRRYPTKNSSLLDSFLEHKIENERLKKRIAALKREEQDDMDGPKQLWSVTQSMNSGESSNAFNSSATTGNAQPPRTTADSSSMPPPAKPTISNTALTQQNLDEVLASSRPDSIRDKMARYEGATHIETIEMLTGLRYRDGERSKGISTGDQSPTLIRGDAGIPYQVDKNGRPAQSGRSYSASPYGEHGDKKKKLKVADEYVCTDCGTLDSPEWRKGPNGPKTLCNACGLRWAKKEKKRTGSRPDSGDGNGGSTVSSSVIGQANSMSGLSGSAHQTPTHTLQPQISSLSPAHGNIPGVPMLAPSTDLQPSFSNRGPS